MKQKNRNYLELLHRIKFEADERVKIEPDNVQHEYSRDAVILLIAEFLKLAD